MRKTALVTGAAGFIGKHLVSALLEDGWDVTGYDLLQKPKQLDCAWAQASIMDVSALKRAMADQDTVFHLAARAHLFAREPKVFDTINHQGTANVIHAAKEMGVHHLVATLSAVALTPMRYAGKITALSERPNLSDLAGPYAQSKWRADRLLARVAYQDLAITRLYPTVPIGPGDDAFTAPTQMIQMFAHKPPPAFLDAAINFVPAIDVAKAHLLAANQLDTTQTNTQRTYLLAGERWTLGQLLDYLAPHCGHALPKHKIPYIVALSAAALSQTWARLRNRASLATLEGVRLTTSDPSFDSEYTYRSLGWTAGPIENALLETLEWLAAERNGRTKA